MSSFTNDFHKLEKLATLGELQPNIGYSLLVCIRNAFLSALRHKLLQSMHCLEQEFVVPIFA